jgi:hypothetical protein
MKYLAMRIKKRSMIVMDMLHLVKVQEVAVSMVAEWI